MQGIFHPPQQFLVTLGIRALDFVNFILEFFDLNHVTREGLRARKWEHLALKNVPTLTLTTYVDSRPLSVPQCLPNAFGSSLCVFVCSPRYVCFARILNVSTKLSASRSDMFSTSCPISSSNVPVSVCAPPSK